MSIERVLEITEVKNSSFIGNFKYVKVGLLVHCSCGEDYRVKEKLNNIESGVQTNTRPSKCPACKEVSYLQHILKRSGPYSTGSYTAIPVTQAVKSKDRTLK